VIQALVADSIKARDRTTAFFTCAVKNTFLQKNAKRHYAMNKNLIVGKMSHSYRSSSSDKASTPLPCIMLPRLWVFQEKVNSGVSD
jgi:hypothetical protein